MHTEEIYQNLSAVLGADRILRRSDCDDAEFLSFGQDRSGLKADFELLAMPRCTEEVARIVRYAAERNISIVPAGGRTGLSGGSTAANGELVITFHKMNQVRSFDPWLPSLTVEAGVTTKTVQEEAQRRGLFFPVDFASSGSSTIGGNIATNAGGIRVIRYGMMRNWVLGLTCVTGRGDILRFPGRVIKDNAGYDLKQLFIGSEGTLCIITEATLRLAEEVESGLLFAGFDDFSAVTQALTRLRKAGLPLLSYEFLDKRSMENVCDHLDLPHPSPRKTAFYVLAEWEIPSYASTHTKELLLQDIYSRLDMDEAIYTETASRKKELWRYRESVSESISARRPWKMDIAIPTDRMAHFLGELQVRAENEGLEVCAFGHVGDGNLHINLMQTKIGDKDPIPAIADWILEQVRQLAGSVSAEHGIGVTRQKALYDTKPAEELRLMQEFKQMLDPACILNPGKVLRREVKRS